MIIIGYFGVVFDLAFQTCNNSCTYVFSKGSYYLCILGNNLYPFVGTVPTGENA